MVYIKGKKTVERKGREIKWGPGWENSRNISNKKKEREKNYKGKDWKRREKTKKKGNRRNKEKKKIERKKEEKN